MKERFRDIQAGDILETTVSRMRYLILSVQIGDECLEIEFYALDEQKREVIQVDPRQHLARLGFAVVGESK